MISFHSQTDIGKRRSRNEDAVFAADNLFVVCDGMGGHRAGEVASRLAIEEIAGFIRRAGEDAEITWPFGFLTRLSVDANRLRTAIKLANRAVRRKASSGEAYAGMGTTVVAMIVSPTRPVMTYAGVGDSRIYLLRSGNIAQLTRDDSWGNLSWQPDAADEATRAAMQHVLTKALGTEDEVDFEVESRELRTGDIVFLCSDGLTNMIPDEKILSIVSAHGSDLEAACQTLVAEANTRGGRDNASAILVRYTS